MSDWFNLIKNKVDDFDEARSILNRPMHVEEWMKPNLKPHRQETSCCDYARQRLRLLPDYKNLPDAYVEQVLDDDCDDVLHFLEEISEISNICKNGYKQWKIQIELLLFAVVTTENLFLCTVG